MVVVCPIDVAGYFSWVPVALLLFLIVFLVLAIANMVARLLSKPDWEARVKVELARMMVSLIFLAGIFTFAEILCTATANIAGGIDPFDTAKAYMATFALRDIPKSINTLWAAAIDARISSTLITPAPSCLAGACYTENAGAIYIANNLETVSNVMIPFSAGLIIQMLVLDIIKQFFLALLLPAGFILKMLPATREGGAYLISIALAFYFVFPMVYVMGDLIHKEIGKGVLLDLQRMVSEVGPGPFEFDGGDSLKAVVALAYVAPYSVTLPLLALVLSLAAARSLFSVFSRDFIGEVPM